MRRIRPTGLHRILTTPSRGRAPTYLVVTGALWLGQRRRALQRCQTFHAYHQAHARRVAREQRRIRANTV